MANAWIPPLFPADGRLGLSIDQIKENYDKREYEKQLAKNRHSYQAK